MKNLISISFFILTLLFLGCKKETINSNESFPWAPKIVVNNNNNNNNNNLVELQLNTPTFLFNKTALFPWHDYSEPDYFEVYISDTGIKNWEHFGSFKNRKEGTQKIEFINLTNNKPYFFKVISKSKNCLESESDPVMIIPGRPIFSEEKVKDILNDRIAHRFSFNKKFEAYHRNYSWETNKSARSVFIQNIATQEETLIEINSSAPAWSTNQNMVAFLSENVLLDNNNSNQSTSLISIFDLEKDTIIRLTERYFGFQLSWSHDGKWITYILDSPNSDEYNNWKVNILSQEKKLVLADIGGLENLALANDKSPRNPVFSYNDESIIFARRTPNSRYYPRNIFMTPSYSEKIERLTNSYWNDDFPVVTLDGNYISFVSNRTGEPQTWCLNIKTKKLYLLTSE